MSLNIREYVIYRIPQVPQEEEEYRGVVMYAPL
nr:MAG TPA: hypothetical protein [Caudoviricetes sp.]